MERKANLVGEMLCCVSIHTLLDRIPIIRQCLKGGSELRPVVKGRGIEIGAVWPDQGVDFRIDLNPVKEGSCNGSYSSPSSTGRKSMT